MEKPSSVCDANEFLVSPYKVCVAALVTVFVEKKSSLTQREIGIFCRLAIKLTQSLDMPFRQLVKLLIANQLSLVVINKFEAKVNSLKSEGLGSMIDLIDKIKSYTCIRKASLLHLFVRRLYLYFDKLNFISVAHLYDDLVLYADDDDEEEMDPNVTVDLEYSVINHRMCPKQMQFFISKQIKLIQVNEKKAMNPKDLYHLLKNAEAQSKHNLNPMAIQNSKKKVELNDVNFLRYLNSLRVNEYLGAKESLFAYFDGISSQNNRCWAALNLAILHSHFNHSQLALEAIKECVSAAQEVNDEKCLENALLWIATVILKQKNRSCQDDEILSLLSHLQKKALKLELSHLAAMASLQLEKLTGLQPKPKGEQATSLYSQRLLGNPDVLAVKHSLTDILMMTYSCRSALFTMIGAAKLNFLMAQSTLYLHAVEPIGCEVVHHVNESTCIAIRNIALHLWKHHAKYEAAKDMLISLAISLFSEYNSSVNAIWKQALAEIEFEKCLFNRDFANALKAIKAIQVFDPIEAKLRLAEYKLRHKNRKGGFDLVEQLLEDAENGQDLTPFIHVRALLLQSALLQNTSILLEAIELSRIHNLKGFEISCKIELCRQILEVGQTEQCRRLLNSIMIPLLSDGSCHDIGKAFHLGGRCWKAIYDWNTHQSVSCRQVLTSALGSNCQAIKQFELIDDKDSLAECYTLQAHLHHALNNCEERNHFARKARLLMQQ